MSREEIRDNLAKELAPMFEEKAAEVENVEMVENKEEVKIEEIDNESEPEAETEGVEEETENKDNDEQSLLELERQLSGHAKEFKELVISITDPELRKKAIEAGKILRAREDKVSSELGEVKKQNQQVANFKQMFDRSPKDTILQIAKMANIDLKSLVEPIAEDNEEYLLPEERQLRQEMKDVRQELQRERQIRQKIIDDEISGEINSFVSNKDLYPYFEELYESIIELLAINNQRNGFPLTSQERVSRMEKAYNKAVLLDDNLLAKRDADLLAKIETKRKADVEKAKTLKKVSVKSAHSDTQPVSPKEALALELQKLGLV